MLKQRAGARRVERPELIGNGDVLEVDRSWPGSAWAVWLWGELHASGPEDDSCVWDYDIVVDTDQPVDVTIPQIIFDEKSQPDAVKKPEPPTVPAGIRWF